MDTDTYWKKKMNNYIDAYALFHKGMSKGNPQLTSDDIYAHWMHFTDVTCDCEGCREDTDCTIHIDTPEDDYTE